MLAWYRHYIATLDSCLMLCFDTFHHFTPISWKVSDYDSHKSQSRGQEVYCCKSNNRLTFSRPVLCLSVFPLVTNLPSPSPIFLSRYFSCEFIIHPFIQIFLSSPSIVYSVFFYTLNIGNLWHNFSEFSVLRTSKKVCDFDFSKSSIVIWRLWSIWTSNI
jgi:ABC-type phosphate transport system permease subunit